MSIRPESYQSPRFDYVRYDEAAVLKQEVAKDLCLDLEWFISANLNGRAAALAFTKLEEVYMWIGKAIRDEQVSLRKDSTPQEGRNNE